jgi:3-oxoacyl-[acyl-carrier protein] reductase
MTCSFVGKRILVTGGTRGIGKSVADYFRTLGATVHITGTSDGYHENDFPRGQYHKVDLNCKKSLSDFLNSIEADMPFDVLVNNAGINKIDHLTEIKDDDFDAVIAVNAVGPFRISKAMAMNMPTGSKIVNIGSIWGSVSKKGRISYSTSKSALIGLTRGLAVDLASKDILVNLVSPGFVDTELTRISLTDEEIISLRAQVPLGRVAKPCEIAKVVAFLCSSDNTFVTGQNIIVDGGFTIV